MFGGGERYLLSVVAVMQVRHTAAPLSRMVALDCCQSPSWPLASRIVHVTFCHGGVRYLGSLFHADACWRTRQASPHPARAQTGSDLAPRFIPCPQSMGYSVDVLMLHRNVCRTKEQLLKVASGLRVSLNPDLLDIFHVTTKGIWLQVRAAWLPCSVSWGWGPLGGG